jgi:hypothetical protein
LIKQFQRQGFAVIVADVLAGMVGQLIETANLVDPTVAGSDQRHQRAVQAPHQSACVEQS